MNFNPSAYTAFDNKTSVTGNPFVASPAAAPIGNNTPAAYFTGNNLNTAYSFDSSVSSLKPWTPGSANSANLAWEAFTDNTSLSFGTDGNFDFSGKPLNVYEKAEEENRKTEEAFRKLKLEEQKANAKNTELILKFLQQLLQRIGSVAGGVPPSMAAAPSTNNAAAAPAPAPAAT